MERHPLDISTMTSTLAPGTRIVVRQEEWLVKKIDRTRSGAQRISVTGLSPLVRGRDALFIDKIEALEEPIQIVDPKATVPTIDHSPYYRDTRLFLEALLRQTVPPDTRLTIGHLGAMDVLPFQLDPARLALQQPRQRILIADAVGLGKTIECGILLTELIRRGRARRILVLTVKSMMTQFQKELWARFSIPLVRLDSTGLQQVRARIPGNHNPFNYYDKTIISIDTVKQDGEYRNHLETAYWDVIVIDEAHNVARRGGSSLRARVAELLASRSDSLILLSATPHDGRRESFASIMNMLNPTAILDETHYGPEDIEGLFIRRFKKDIADQIRGKFPERQMMIHRHPASSTEEAAYSCLTALTFQEIDRVRQGGALLFKTLLEKSLFSSPAACLDTIDGRIHRIRQRPDAERYDADVRLLNRLRELVSAIGTDTFSKYQALLAMLRPGSSESIGWNSDDSNDRLIIFTERIATLNWLAEHLPRDLGLSPSRTGVLHGGMSDTEQQELVEAFGNETSPIRLLLASDVASEGINLHYFCHRLIHFDIPWSLLTFQQRNGRIDRYGQERRPQLHYLLSESRNSKIHGDQRILEILVEKDRQVQENIGDPSEFTGLHTPEEEEAKIAEAIESGMRPEEFNASFGGSPQTDDPFLAAMLGQLPESSGHSTSLEEHVAVPLSLFPDDYAWAKEAIAYAQTKMRESLQVSFADSRQELELVLPKDLLDRIQRLPDEIRPRDGTWLLTPNRKAVMDEMAVCRREANRWPRVHLLWQQHPAMEWLHDKILCAFGRQEVPVVQLDTLSADDSIVLTTGILPNRMGRPLIQRWVGIRFQGTTLKDRLDMETVMAITHFDRKRFPNPETAFDIRLFQQLISPAVDAMQAEMHLARQAFNEQIRPELDRQLQRLARFKSGRTEQLKRRFEKMVYIRDAEIRKVRDLYEEYRSWIRDTLETEDQASIRVAAIFTGKKAC